MENTFSIEGMPAKVKMIKKPEGIGQEMKGVVDGMSKVMTYKKVKMR